MTGVTENKGTVYDAVSQFYTQFLNTHWQEHGQKDYDWTDLYVAMAKFG